MMRRVLLRPLSPLARHPRSFHSSVKRLRTPPVPLPSDSHSPPESTSSTDGPHPSPSANEPPSKKQRSRHGDWYATTVPAMIPIALVATAIYYGLKLTRETLSHDKYLDEAEARVKALEAELEDWKTKQLAASKTLAHVDQNSSPQTTDAQQGGSKGRWWTLGLL